MKKILIILILGMFSVCLPANVRISFDDVVKVADGRFWPKDWERKCTKLGIPATRFNVLKNRDGKYVLRVSANKATGVLMMALCRLVDLKKMPIMRWKWRVLKYPEGADGRVADRDDQPIAIYIGAHSGFLMKHSMCLRWETETPKNTEGKVVYGGGIVKVKWFCLRNKHDGLNNWRIDQFNVADAYRKAYGRIPEEYSLSIGANSQYTESNTVAEIEYIEFITAPDADKKAGSDGEQLALNSRNRK